jgi:glutamate N-acetyltransferase/amino-acid N-acetyltransferase
VAITRERLASGRCRAILLNSGNANACTGEKGLQNALDLTAAAAGRLDEAPELVIPLSTGVIGVPLPVDRMLERIPGLLDGLDDNKSGDVAQAIMTTDTIPKTSSVRATSSAGEFSLLGIAKGAGMIAPNMATLLVVIMTDIAVETPFLRECLVDANSRTFNCVTVDGDTSTNDTLILMSSTSEDAKKLGPGESDKESFAKALDQVCSDLARQIVADGEGATKVVDVVVRGLQTREAAIQVARTIAESPLVKTAFHGEDPNWGRIICAAGRAGVFFDTKVVDLFIGDTPVMKDGMPVSGDWDTPANRVMKNREFSVVLDLKSGPAEAVFLTTDLSADYVRINADYRS